MSDILLKKICFDNMRQTAKQVNIGFGIDDNYVRPMATAIASVRANLAAETGLAVHIITDGIGEENLAKLKLLAQQLSIKINIYVIDVKEFKKLPMQIVWTHAIYFRLVLPMLIDKHIDKLYYLDADIVALKSLDEFFDLNFDNDEIVMAVPDVDFVAEKRIEELELKNHIYFNSGVLGINLPEWNKFNVLEKVIKAINTAPERFKYYDQDALNLVLTGRIKYLDRKYNYMHNSLPDKEKTVILHYAANPKPWKFYFALSRACNDFNKEYYAFYEKNTPWAAEPLDKPLNYKEMEACAKCLMKNGQYFDGLKWKWRYLRARSKQK